MSRRLQWNLIRGALLLCLALGSLTLGIVLHRRQPNHPVPQALIAFLDVGDGDCTLIRTISGTTILLDAGRAESGPSIVRALHQFHVRTVDLLVLASSDAKSLGGVPAVLEAFPVRNVWDNAAQDRGPARRNALEAIRRRHLPSRTVHAGDNIQIGSATFWTAVWPPAHGPRARIDSVVYQLDFGTTRVLFAGPSLPEGEQYLIANRGESLGCDDQTCTDLILQATAGGASGGTSAEILREAAPAVVVVSSGAAHPPPFNMLHRLQAAGAALWRTDTQGTVIVLTDGHSTPTITATHL